MKILFVCQDNHRFNQREKEKKILSRRFLSFSSLRKNTSVLYRWQSNKWELIDVQTPTQRGLTNESCTLICSLLNIEVDDPWKRFINKPSLLMDIIAKKRNLPCIFLLLSEEKYMCSHSMTSISHFRSNHVFDILSIIEFYSSKCRVLLSEKNPWFAFFSSDDFILNCMSYFSDRNVLRVHSLVRMDLMEDLKLDFLSLGNARASVSHLHSPKTNVLIHHPIDWNLSLPCIVGDRGVLWKEYLS